MLRTRFTDLFGVDYPVMSAPMAMHSGGKLAAAVSTAGGLGTFGGIHSTKGPDWLREEIAYIRSQTDAPFGVGFITPFLPMFEGHFQAVFDERVPIIALSFGGPQPWLDKAKTAGAKVICQAQSMVHAQEAVDGGADVLVAQGNEAGGHTGTMNLLPLLVSMLDRFPNVPVLASGGIASGRALAAVLAAGADGASSGTAFLATPECIQIPEEHKRIIVESDGEDTVFTRAYDVLWGAPWPQGIAERGRRNRFTDEWDGRDKEIIERREELQARVQAADHDFDATGDRAVLYGQSAGAVNAIRPAAEVLREICDDAERILRERSQALLT
jgi:nitronate monooxygenase